MRSFSDLVVANFQSMQKLVSPSSVGSKIALLAVFSSGIATAADWRQIRVPDTKCGDGNPYEFRFKQGASSKIIIEFEGGGACWDSFTCFGPAKLTKLNPKPFEEESALGKGDSDILNLRDFSYVFFPYCTGDVHIGNHKANYGDKPVFHYGKQNVSKTFEYLSKTGLVDWTAQDNVILYGASAGAIGALFSLESIEKLVPQSATKSLVADSPGLHFGERFWDKFPSSYKNDFDVAFSEIGLRFDDSDGNVASQMSVICEKYSNWNIGFLQADKDLVMSVVFGNTTPEKHEKRVYGRSGILAATQNPQDTCRSWVKSTAKHTFLTKGSGGKEQISIIKKVFSITAVDFLKSVITGKTGLNVSDKQ